MKKKKKKQYYHIISKLFFWPYQTFLNLGIIIREREVGTIKSKVLIQYHIKKKTYVLNML